MMGPGELTADRGLAAGQRVRDLRTGRVGLMRRAFYALWPPDRWQRCAEIVEIEHPDGTVERVTREACEAAG